MSTSEFGLRKQAAPCGATLRAIVFSRIFQVDKSLPVNFRAGPKLSFAFPPNQAYVRALRAALQ
jgi:hypothetical protein